MDVREKLVGLLREVQYQGNAVHGYHDKYIQNGELADYLIDHGVTVQEWIPAYDYPKETGFYNCYYKTPDSNLWRVGMCYWNDTNWIQVGFMPVAVPVMFYMPLPQPPKGE